MKVLNRSKGTTVAEDPILANTFLSRLRGLMFRLRFPKAILFFFPSVSPKRNAIHSFFVFFSFDAVYLDEEKKVIDIYESIKPFTPYVEPKKPARYLLELEAGAVRRFGIEVGDDIEF